MLNDEDKEKLRLMVLTAYDRVHEARMRANRAEKTGRELEAIRQRAEAAAANAAVLESVAGLFD